MWREGGSVGKLVDFVNDLTCVSTRDSDVCTQSVPGMGGPLVSERFYVCVFHLQTFLEILLSQLTTRSDLLLRQGDGHSCPPLTDWDLLLIRKGFVVSPFLDLDDSSQCPLLRVRFHSRPDTYWTRCLTRQSDVRRRSLLGAVENLVSSPYYHRPKTFPVTVVVLSILEPCTGPVY